MHVSFIREVARQTSDLGNLARRFCTELFDVNLRAGSKYQINVKSFRDYCKLTDPDLKYCSRRIQQLSDLGKIIDSRPLFNLTCRCPSPENRKALVPRFFRSSLAHSLGGESPPMMYVAPRGSIPSLNVFAWSRLEVMK